MPTETTLQPPAPVLPPVADHAGLRHQVAPWGATGALLLAAAASRATVHATGHEQAVAWTVAITAFVTAVVVAHATKRRLMPRRLRHRFVAALYLGALWLATVTAAGLSWAAVTVLALGGSALSLLYWREHRIGAGQPPAAAQPATQPDQYVTRWDTNLGTSGKPLAGSTLGHRENIKAGYRYVLHLVPGTQTVGQVRAMVEPLRGGLHLLPGQDLIVETHPTLPAPTALLTIITRPAVTKPQLWPGPDAGVNPATGSVFLGPFADGEGLAEWAVYRQDGMFGGYLQGGPGSGKSRMIESICMSLAASRTHPTIIWYADGQQGNSSPLLVNHADWAATQYPAILEMLRAAVRVMQINGVENRLGGRVGFTPTDQRPGLLVVIDEQHNVFDPAQNPDAAECRNLAATIAREGRKVGVADIGASQSPTLDAFGGAGNNADVLRSSMLAGNGGILRSETDNAKRVFGVDISPRQFPPLPGYAYLARPEADARSAPFRGYWVTDRMAQVWPSRIVWRSLPRRQANAAGEAYARRREVAAEQIAQDQLLLQLADAGTLDLAAFGGPAVGQTSAPAGGVVVHFDDVHPPVRRVERFWLRARASLLPGQRKVLDAIRAGNTSPKQIIDATGYSESQVYNLLGDLTRLGVITKTKYGQYAVISSAA